MRSRNKKTTENMDWKTASQPFNERAEEYDNWFENSLLFEVEITALRAIKDSLPHPRLEIGVGPGRFGEALNVDFGIDPAISPLQLATRRSIIGTNGVGEHLPFQTGSMGTVFILFTLCFLSDSAAVFKECSRIINPDGRLVIGLIPRLSSWGVLLADKGKKKHPFYRHARMRTIAETVELLAQNGFKVSESWSTLLQDPKENIQPETPRQGINENAGFSVLVTSKKGDAR